MIHHRILERPAFRVIGKKTWISGQDNDLFGRFWDQCRAEGLFKVFEQLSGLRAGEQTNGTVLGVSRVEQDPTLRAFDYMIAVEHPSASVPPGLELYEVPASRWAVFESHGKMPDALVEAEMYAFMQWLPASGYKHAFAPEMEVYPLTNANEGETIACEFWLPIVRKEPGEGT